MTSFRFVHAADLHLDTPFAGVAQPAPGVAAALRDASLTAWDALVDLTIAEGAAFLLLAGDIYDGSERGVRAQLRFGRGLERLAEASVRVFIVHGNHDPLGDGSGVGYPANTTVFVAGEVESVPVSLDGEQAAIVHGISYGKRETTENLARRFRRATGDGLQIGLLHANVGAIAEHGAYAPCTRGDLEAAGLDYWALGHVHKRQTLRAGDPWIVYPGDIQGRSPKPSEMDAKGALVVSVTGTHVNDVRFVPLDAARFVACPVDIAAAIDLPQVQTQLVETLLGLRDEHAGRDLLVRATLEGRSPLAADLRRSGALNDILTEARAEFEQVRPFLWIESIVDRSRSVIDIEALRQSEGFAAELVRFADERSGDAAASAAFVARQDRLLDQGTTGGALRRLQREDDTGLFADDSGEIFATALSLAVDLLGKVGEQ
jgi:exonuclease SbcD